jgi:hypothetical protein
MWMWCKNAAAAGWFRYNYYESMDQEGDGIMVMPRMRGTSSMD